MKNAEHFIVWYTTVSGIKKPFSVAKEGKAHCLFTRKDALRHSLALALKGYVPELDDVQALLE